MGRRWVRVLGLLVATSLVAVSFAAAAGASGDETLEDPTAVAPPTDPPADDEPVDEEPVVDEPNVDAPATMTTTTSLPDDAATTSAQSLDVGALDDPVPYIWHSSPANVQLIGNPLSVTHYWADNVTETAYGGSVPVNVTCPAPTTYVTWVVRMRFLPMIPPFLWSGFRNLDVTFKKDGSASDSVEIPTIDYIENTLHGRVDELSPTDAAFTPYCHNDPWDSGGSSGYSLGSAFNRLESRINPALDPGSGSDNDPPVASFTQTPSGAGPGSIHFVSTSTDPDNDALSYDWDFGDGSPHGIGANDVHQYTTPGNYTAKLTVTDTSGASDVDEQPVLVAAPTLGVDVSFPEHPSGSVPPGREFTARVLVSASAGGVGDLSDLDFVGDVVRITRGVDVVEVVDQPTVSSPFTLAPGTSESFDVTMRAAGQGRFTLESTVAGKDAADQPVTTTSPPRNGNVSPLAVELDGTEVGNDAVEVTMSVINQGANPIDGLEYPGTGGLTLRPELIVGALRGEVVISAGPTPPLPSSLEPGETATTTFRLVAEAPGTVALVARAVRERDGSMLSAVDTADVEVGDKKLTQESLRDWLIALAEGNQELAQDELRRLQTSAGKLLRKHLDAAIKRGDTDLKSAPAGLQSDLVPFDNPSLALPAMAGMLSGIGKGTYAGLDFAAITPAKYYLGLLLNLDPGQGLADYVDGGIALKGGADAVAYGTFSALFNGYDLATSQLNSGVAPNDFIGAMNADSRQHEVLEAAIAPSVQELERKFEAYLQSQEAEIAKDPEGWAFRATEFVGKLIGEEVFGEAVVRGGTKLAEVAIKAAESSAQTRRAVNRLTSTDTLEALGENARVTTAQVERLGGITQTDSAKIQQITKEMNEKYADYNLNLEIQARPSNVHSAKFLNDAEAYALPKPEVFKAKNISDIDVVLGADGSALGQLGVFKPKLPSDAALRKKGFTTEAQLKEVRDRFKTQEKVWTEWNDPNSEFAKKFAKASQEGGADFKFEVPTGFEQAPNAPRTYHIQATSTPSGRNQTTLIQAVEDGRTRPIVSDIDFHAYIQADGNIPASIRQQVELDLDRAFSQSGIAYGQHGATKNAPDWAGLNRPSAATARMQFGIESRPASETAGLVKDAAARIRKATADQATALEERAARLEAVAPNLDMAGRQAALSEANRARNQADALRTQLAAFKEEDLLKGLNPGKFVVKFRADSIHVGSGVVF